jgi:hypothetical protein
MPRWSLDGERSRFLTGPLAWFGMTRAPGVNSSSFLFLSDHFKGGQRVSLQNRPMKIGSA